MAANDTKSPSVLYKIYIIIHKLKFTLGMYIIDVSYLYTVFRARRITFFPVLRVEQKKLNHPAAGRTVWLSFFVQLGLTARGVTD